MGARPSSSVSESISVSGSVVDPESSVLDSVSLVSTTVSSPSTVPVSSSVGRLYNSHYIYLKIKYYVYSLVGLTWFSTDG